MPTRPRSKRIAGQVIDLPADGDGDDHGGEGGEETRRPVAEEGAVAERGVALVRRGLCGSHGLRPRCDGIGRRGTSTMGAGPTNGTSNKVRGGMCVKISARSRDFQLVRRIAREVYPSQRGGNGVEAAPQLRPPSASQSRRGRSVSAFRTSGRVRHRCRGSPAGSHRTGRGRSRHRHSGGGSRRRRLPAVPSRPAARLSIQAWTMSRRLAISGSSVARKASRRCSMPRAMPSSMTLPQMPICSLAARNVSCSAASLVISQPMRMPGMPKALDSDDDADRPLAQRGRQRQAACHRTRSR